jgi:hypothetical protein
MRDSAGSSVGLAPASAKAFATSMRPHLDATQSGETPTLLVSSVLNGSTGVPDASSD